jgi:hypothetical protein
MHDTHATPDLAEEFTGVFDAATVKEQALPAAEHLPGATVGAFRGALAGGYAKDLRRRVERRLGNLGVAVER